MLLCTRCGIEPRSNQAPDATKRWCTKCHTAYMRKWRADKLQQAYDRGFSKGAEAMREKIWKRIVRIPGALLQWSAVEGIVRHSRPPTVAGGPK